MTDAKNLLPGLDERRVEHRGARLRVWEGGSDGPLLLLLHGFGGSAWNFSELLPLLGARRVLIPDLPGHGGSAALPAAPTLAAYADAVAACVDEPVDVFGHSMGGVVALRLAERRPDLVRRLVLAAAAGITSSTRLSELAITLVGLVQPGRAAGRQVDRIARSPRLRRLVFGGLEVANTELLTERAVHGLLRGPTMHTGCDSAPVAPSPRMTRGRTWSVSGARCSCCGEHVTGKCLSRTGSNMRAA